MFILLLCGLKSLACSHLKNQRGCIVGNSLSNIKQVLFVITVIVQSLLDSQIYILEFKQYEMICFVNCCFNNFIGFDPICMCKCGIFAPNFVVPQQPTNCSFICLQFGTSKWANLQAAIIDYFLPINNGKHIKTCIFTRFHSYWDDSLKSLEILKNSLKCGNRQYHTNAIIIQHITFLQLFTFECTYIQVCSQVRKDITLH